MKNSNSSFLKGFVFACNGLAKAIRTERNLKVHMGISILVCMLGFAVQLSTIEWCLIIACMGLVMGAELMNSAIEKLVDMVSPGFDARAGLVKDIAAGAVLVCAITSAIIGLFIFIPKLLTL
jgi:diacylglycerol kinase